jgi:cytochrome c oxidase cbb3-type subunit 3
MPDFVSQFWSWFIIIPVVLGLIFCVILLRANSGAISKEGESTGHVWDEDLEELNNPLPKWWLQLFYITLVFAVVYLLLYPGLGTFKGFLDWSSVGRYEQEVAAAEASFAPLYAGYLATPMDKLATDPKAMGTAKRLFATNCSICHGSDAGGATGFPNLRDDDWLYGGDENTVKTTINNGRNAVMPAWVATLGEQGVEEVAEYIYSLTRKPVNAHYVKPGEEKFKTFCVACHGADGKGNPALGAPNLTDKTWLYGGSLGAIRESISTGRSGQMPAFSGHLNDSQIHLLTSFLKSIQESGTGQTSNE